MGAAPAPAGTGHLQHSPPSSFLCLQRPRSECHLQTPLGKEHNKINSSNRINPWRWITSQSTDNHECV